jgi:hypothetical protein
MKKNLIIFLVVLIAVFLCVGAVSASDGSNTTLKKTVSVSTDKKIVATAPKIVQRGSKTFSSGSGREVCTWYLVYYNKNSLKFVMLDKYQLHYNGNWHAQYTVLEKATIRKYSTKGKIYVTDSYYGTGQKNLKTVKTSYTAKSTAYRTCIQQWNKTKKSLIKRSIDNAHLLTRLGNLFN